MTFERIRPDLIVDDLPACLPFWVARFGFEVVVSVPHGDAVGFVILKSGDIEIMLQSRASLADDVPPISHGDHRAVLYIDVPDLAPIREAVRDWPHVVPERTTAYGAQEIIVTDPAGHVLFFASHA